jgi:Na+/H+ antiporter NhaD/arsenite permease-like protein
MHISWGWARSRSVFAGLVWAAVVAVLLARPVAAQNPQPVPLSATAPAAVEPALPAVSVTATAPAAPTTPTEVSPPALTTAPAAAHTGIPPAPEEKAPAAAHPTAPGQATPAHDGAEHEGTPEGHGYCPSLVAILPFVAILLSIALLPLIPSVEHWWHHNRNKLIISAILTVVTLVYYFFRKHGFHTEAGFPSVVKVLQHAVLADYVPFIILLLSLYTISGGIQLRGDLRARPFTNVAFLGLGAILASIIGTTGASMLLIRPLLQTNSERKHVRHTVIFFIFLVSNIGGCLLPTGDPPLFMGYLRGVPFLWTLGLWKEWLFTCCLLLVIYWIWDSVVYRKETEEDRWKDRTHIEPLRVAGGLNFVWLVGVVAAVGLMVPNEKFLGTSFVVPTYLREGVLLVLVIFGWISSSPAVRKANSFDFQAIAEVAALFIGIFITMQVPIEILRAKGPSLGLAKPWEFFWATGTLSSFLDNTPTYVVYFETANSMTHAAGAGIMHLLDGNYVRESLLVAISLGSVFMGANTYIGNAPNFMVKSIAEQSGIKMPSFFGYMFYSVGILVPLFLLVMVIFML